MPSAFERILNKPGYSPFIRWTAACLVFMANAMEHVAFYSINGTVIYYLTSYMYAWNMTNASIALASHEIIKYIMIFVGGFLADFIMGRLTVLLIAYILNFIGFLGLLLLNLNSESPPRGAFIMCLPSNKSINNTSMHDFILKPGHTRPFFSEDCSGWVIIFLGFIATGGGFIDIVLPVLGANQVHTRGAHAIRTFFVFFYMSSNIGSLIANTVVVYTECNSSIKNAILTLFLTLCVSASFIFLGRCLFLLNKTKASLRTIFGILKEGIQSRKNRIRDTANDDRHMSCLDRTKLNNGGNFEEIQVEGVKRYSLCMVAFYLLIPYFLLFCQLDTFILQGAHMKMHLESYGNHSLPPTFVQGFDSASVMLMAPLLALIIYPWLQRRTNSPCMRLRVLTGMVFAMLSLLIAGIVETYRLEVFWGRGNNSTHPAASSFVQTIGKTSYFAADMSFLWLIPQNFLFGVSELLVYVTALEFAYISSVPRLHCFSLATITLSLGVSRAIVAGLTSGLDGVIFAERNINWRRTCPQHGRNSSTVVCWESHLDYIFYGLSVIQALFIPIVAVVVYRVWPLIFNSAAALEYQEDEVEEDDERDPLLR